MHPVTSTSWRRDGLRTPLPDSATGDAASLEHLSPREGGVHGEHAPLLCQRLSCSSFPRRRWVEGWACHHGGSVPSAQTQSSFLHPQNGHRGFIWCTMWVKASSIAPPPLVCPRDEGVQVERPCTGQVWEVCLARRPQGCGPRGPRLGAPGSLPGKEAEEKTQERRGGYGLNRRRESTSHSV